MVGKTYKNECYKASEIVREALDEMAVDFWHGTSDDMIETRGMVIGYVECIADRYGYNRDKVLMDVMALVEGDEDEED